MAELEEAVEEGLDLLDEDDSSGLLEVESINEFIEEDEECENVIGNDKKGMRRREIRQKQKKARKMLLSEKTRQIQQRSLISIGNRLVMRRVKNIIGVERKIFCNLFDVFCIDVIYVYACYN